MKNLLGSKGGQASSWFAAIIFIFGFVVITFISFLILLGLKQGFIDAGFWTGKLASTGDNFINALKFFDKLTIFFVAVFIVGAAITTYRLASGPVFYVVLFLQAAFYGYISYFFNYMFIAIATNEGFSSVVEFFPLSIIICTNLHWVMLAMFFVGGIFMFGKKEKGQFLT